MNDLFALFGWLTLHIIDAIQKIPKLFKCKNKSIVKCKNCGEMVAHNWIDGNRCFFCQHDDELYKYTRP